MDIFEQLESKIRASLSRYEELKQKIKNLEEENKKLKEFDKERTEKLQRLLNSLDEKPNNSEDISEEQGEIIEDSETADEGEDIF